MSRRRKLSRDDLELWRRVAETAEPMRPQLKKNETEPRVSKPPKTAKVTEPVDPFQIGVKAQSRQSTHDVAGDLGESLRAAPVNMDRKKHQSLKRGKLKPEGKIDLHGMTLDQAHPRLTSFIMRAHADGKRLVLVVTGKGKPRDDGGPIPVRLGVLRHQVPQWLTTPPLSQIVLQISEAHLRHGGGGAYYVYLRRKR